MIKKLIYIFLLLNVIRAFSQSMSDECELNGSIFYSDCVKYIGECKNNKANGWGDLYLKNNNILTGLFVDNILQNFHLKVLFTNTNKYVIGPNKGSNFHGPCISIDKDYVSLCNYDNGRHVGNSDYFNIPNPNFEFNEIFCDAYGTSAKDRSNCNLIPNTNSIIYVSNRGGKEWISIVDLSTNRIIRNYGTYSRPIKGNLKFKGFTSDNQFAFFDIRMNENEAPKFLRCNLITGISEIKSMLPKEITNHENFISELNSSTYKDLIFEAGKEGTIKDVYHILKDSSYVKFFNNKLYVENREYGTGSSLVLYSKKHEVVKSLDLSNLNILDFAIDENTNRIALSYRGKDTTYLSYFDLKSFQFVSNIFKRIDNPFDYRVKFSKTGKYLLYNLKSGTAIYLGNKLYYGVEGVVYDLSNEDNVIVTNDNGYLNVYDLEKKTIIMRYKIEDTYAQTKYFNIGNKMYIISGYPKAWDGTIVTENGIKINSFVMPKPLLSPKEFLKNPDEIEEARRLAEKERIEEERRVVESDKITIGNIDIYYKDLGIFNYNDAVQKCNELGDGWRLPSPQELDLFVKNLDRIGNLTTVFNSYTDNKGYFSKYIDGAIYWGENAKALSLRKESIGFGIIKNLSGEIRQQTFFFSLRPVRLNPEMEKERKETEDAQASYVLSQISYSKLFSGQYGSSKSTPQNNQRQSHNSSNKKRCRSCKPNYDKGWWITDYDDYMKKFTNGRWIKNIGHKPCSRCNGTGNCRAYSQCESNSKSYICKFCKGDRWEECNNCKGTGETK